MRALLGFRSDTEWRSESEILDRGVFELSYNHVVIEYGSDVALSLMAYMQATRNKH